ncbi:MAG: hypothetical protein KY468_08575 [Armatimonadetes bacterium]|nr:hypothetical protein [Armatimonadota bacterium]
MTRHVIGVYGDVDQVQRAVESLLAEGITEDQVSVLRWEDSRHGEELLEYEQAERTEAITTGLWGGGAIGAIAGLLAEAVTLIAAPPIGAIAIAGALATALGGATIGATVGGFAGTLAHIGITAQEADHYMERLEAGATILAVAVPTTKAEALRQRLEALGAEETDIV